MTYDFAAVKESYAELTSLIKKDLSEEFDNRRIKSSEYADVYEKLIATCLQLAFEVPIREKQLETETLNQSLQTERIQSENVKQALTNRQITGFDDNVKMKLTEMQMNAWSVMYSSGLLEAKPSIIEDDKLSGLYTGLSAQVDTNDVYVTGPGKLRPGGKGYYKIENYNNFHSYEVTDLLNTGATIERTANLITVTATTTTDVSATLAVKATKGDGTYTTSTVGITW
jgi:hypothetical protein